MTETGNMNKTQKLNSVICSTFSGVLTLTSAANLCAIETTMTDTTLLSNVTFVVFDTETTGWSDENGYVIEIGAVKFKNGKTLAQKSWLINPGTPITPASQQIHGISDAMVEKSPSFKEVFTKFSAFIKDTALLAHNASFDVRFIDSELKRNRIEPPTNPIFDTLRLTRKWYPEFASHSLSNLVQELNIPAGKLHRALADSDVTRQIFLEGLKKMPETASIADLKELSGTVLFFKK